ncbi:SCA7-domain-containing protein [Polychaeton citri CBS 116435]|uniref:SCA7-domain-containing protein n=1 Tax=Polychaeton citri CBS 116435 TaxID=1314669 RepID=A0A9P4Q9G5_9PEZI|nr:SCA7-domain-containing protein [Polychaeton citri CBS 116435]
MSIKSLFSEIEDGKAKLSVKDDARQALPLVKKPGNWDSDINNSVAKGKENTNPRPTPQVNKIPSNLADAFASNRPMRDRPDILKCTHCKRAVNRPNMPKHIEGCLNKKQEKQRKKKEAKDARDAAARKLNAGSDEEDEDAGKTASKTGGLTASKKRKANDGGDSDNGPSKKKKKKDADGKKAPRPKAPVDVEKQCGVELPQGGQCARSLTCKSHSMGAKRSVPGRSKPYDTLLAEYQRKNAAKLQKAQYDANAPNPEDEGLPTGPVDSEEEKEQVMSGIARAWGGAPIYQPVIVPLRKKYEFNRMRGMLTSALSGGQGGGGLFGGGGVGGGFFGSAAPAVQPPASGPTVDADGVIHARRGSVVPGARSMMPGSTTQSRKASVASLGNS